VGYHLVNPLKGSKPTVVLISGFMGTATAWRPQIDDKVLNEAVNLLILEPLGNGSTKTNSPVYTLWDSAYAFIQVFDALGVKRAMVFGTSLGGWIATRMALYAPERIYGLGLSSTTFDSASQGSVDRGCADVTPMMLDMITNMTGKPDQNFKIPAEFTAPSAAAAIFGPEVKESDTKLWQGMVTSAYTGEEGRKKLHQAAIAMFTRDSLHLRVPELTMPILWIQGDGDTITSVKNAEFEMKLTNSLDPILAVVKGGYHALTITHAEETRNLILAFVKKHSGIKDARSLRESVGTVDI